MRMDRYEEEELDKNQTRTNKNQELYTDVYLNNVYVDIDNLKEVMDDNENPKEEVKTSFQEPLNYNYEEKSYDIREIINDKLNNKEEDNLKRSLDKENEEINNLIQSISENKKDISSDTLLSDLMPDSNTTTIMPGLSEPIIDTSLIDTSIIHKDESNDFKDLEETKEETEVDDSFKDEVKSKKWIVFLIIGIILIIVVVLGILYYKGIIKIK